MTITSFEEVISWQKAHKLTLELYKIFRESKDFGFKDQILRCSVSIMNNIAEGFERRGDRELRNFLSIAKGSCGELRSMLYLARDLKYISPELFTSFHQEAVAISRLLSGFIRSLHI
jgi:four helix bundle protein